MNALVQNILWQIQKCKSKQQNCTMVNGKMQTCVTNYADFFFWFGSPSCQCFCLFVSLLYCLPNICLQNHAKSISSLVNMNNIQLFSGTNWNNKWTNTIKTYFKCCARLYFVVISRIFSSLERSCCALILWISICFVPISHSDCLCFSKCIL